MTNIIAKIADLTSKLREICESNPDYDVRVNSHSSKVFINSPELFFETFEKFVVDPYKSVSSKYNYELHVEVEGVKFSTILTQSEYEKYVQKK